MSNLTKEDIQALPQGTIIENAHISVQYEVRRTGICVLNGDSRFYGKTFDWSVIPAYEEFCLLEEISSAEIVPTSCNCNIISLLQQGCACGSIRRWEER